MKSLEIKEATGVIRWWLLKQCFWAITLPTGIYVLTGRGYPWLIRHEREHEAQINRMGVVRFYVTYLWYQIRYGYDNNPLEQAARAAEWNQNG